MTATPRRVLNGPELIRAEARVRELLKRRELSPYAWHVAPPDADRVHARGGIAVPAANTVTEILNYVVPANRWFWLTAIIQLYLGGTSLTLAVPGDGQIAWDLDVDIPVGIASPQGYQVQGFSEQLTAGLGDFPYGNFQSGLNTPYALPKPELIGPEKTLRSKVQVNNTIAGNAGRFISIFYGWLVPTDF